MKKDIEKTLKSLGYSLIDRGGFWHSAAVYRGGDNKTALQIYKDTGVWRDFVKASPFYPFEKLVKLTVGEERSVDILKRIEQDKPLDLELEEKAPKMDIPTFFSHKEVETLVPHYSFYNKKKISDNTLKLYRCGMAMSGKMNGRFVFPVFDENGKVVGMSGRILLPSSSAPKWKHIGVKRDWIYPINIKPRNDDNPFLNSIEEKKEIILVESIGDSLALTQNGFFNHIVLFGVDISSKQIGFLLSQNPSKIIISLNNDKEKADNTGLNSSIKIYLKLLEFFEVSKLQIILPLKKDFGEMNESEIDFSLWRNKDIDNIKQVKWIAEKISSPEFKTFSGKKKILNSYLKSC